MLSNLNSNNKALTAILLAVILGGGNPALTKIALLEIPNFSFTFVRFLIATLVILPFFLKDLPKIDKNFYKALLFTLFLTLNVTLFPIGVSLTTATISQMIYVFNPILVAIFSYFLFKEVFNVKKITGIILGLIGALVIILLPKLSSGSPFSGNLEGNLIITVAAIATAIYFVSSKALQKYFNPLQLTSIFIFETTIILFFLALTDFTNNPFWWNDLSFMAVFSVLYVAILGTIVYYFLTQYSIKHGSALIASMSLYLQPITVFLFANLLLGERLVLGLIIGAILAFAGVYLTLQSKK